MSFMSKLSRVFGGGGGPDFPPGTRAFESKLTIDLLEKEIGHRRQEGASPEELAYLGNQLAQHHQVVAAGDTSPGTGSIGYDAYPG